MDSMKGLLNGTYVSDGLLVQIHRAGVKFCFPTTAAHVKGFPFSLPFCTSRCPDNSISSGAVGEQCNHRSYFNPLLFVCSWVRGGPCPVRQYPARGGLRRPRPWRDGNCKYLSNQWRNSAQSESVMQGSAPSWSALRLDAARRSKMQETAEKNCIASECAIAKWQMLLPKNFPHNQATQINISEVFVEREVALPGSHEVEERQNQASGKLADDRMPIEAMNPTTWEIRALSTLDADGKNEAGG
ncbi:hypothetical protein KSP40_PGU006864 [Platanthera guangdongensis]|uniref:Uncharacterized protein n=1 Tax=Platanthera guangdongensis TaxID=2320717 RepID=A0ABR2M1F8_9ASPA